jgi:hypothetical protein
MANAVFQTAEQQITSRHEIKIEQKYFSPPNTNRIQQVENNVPGLIQKRNDVGK